MSGNHKLITKQYQQSLSSVPAWSVATLGTIDLANHNSEYTENLVKIEFSFGATISPYYLSAELHVLINTSPLVGVHVIPSPDGLSCGQLGDYPIGTAANNSLYSHLMYPDNANFINYFRIGFSAPGPHPTLPDYNEITVFAVTPNYDGHLGAVITTYYPNHLPQNHDY